MLINASMGGDAASADYDLLRGGADFLEVALLAARSAAATRRVAENGGLDAEDKRSLRSIGSYLSSTARALEYFESGGQIGSPPSGQLAARFDVALEAVSHVPPESSDAKAIAKALDDISKDVEAFVENESPGTASRLHAFFVELALLVLRETGQVGERTSIL